MLSTQVQYWALQETKWHNRATEQQARNELKETIRSHQATEAIGWANVNESIRHDVAMESETYRSNRAREVETHRANKEHERLQLYSITEQERHDIATENLTRQQIGIQRGQLAVAQVNANTNRLQANIAGYNAATNRAVGLKNSAINARNADTRNLEANIKAFEAQNKADLDWATYGDQSLRGWANILVQGTGTTGKLRR